MLEKHLPHVYSGLGFNLNKPGMADVTRKLVEAYEAARAAGN